MKNVILPFLLISLIFSSCKKEEITRRYDFSNLIVQDTDPYTGTFPMGAATYFLLFNKIESDSSIGAHNVFINRATTLPLSDMGKIYYNKQAVTFQSMFGSLAQHGNKYEFAIQTNERINQFGYAIVAFYYDGGPNYNYCELTNY